VVLIYLLVDKSKIEDNGFRTWNFFFLRWVTNGKSKLIRSWCRSCFTLQWAQNARYPN